MLKFIGVVPHSPLLIPSSSGVAAIPKAVNDGFAKLVQQMQELSISKIIVIGSHPMFERPAFSVYINDIYNITFRDFGDLVTRQEVTPWLEGYTRLADLAGAQLLEPISEQDIDYAHGVPLFHIRKVWGDDKVPQVLCINCHAAATEEQLIDFAHSIRTLLAKTAEPTAIICSGDLFLTKDFTLGKEVSEENKKIRRSIEASLTMPSDLLEFSKQVSQPCITLPLRLCREIIGPARHDYEEYCFETDQKTSYLISGLKLY